MNNGYTGRILNVNLSTRQSVAANLDAKVVQNFIGGIGLGVKILYDEVGPGVDALSADNIMVIAPGPLSGTDAPTSGRTNVVTKSPWTGIIGTGNFGGWWGPRLKFTGFEAIVVRGASDNPVYLWIDNGVAQIRKADHLWGKDTWQTTDALKKELGNDISVLAIGPAGENLVRFACPIADYDHAPGRSAAGCVMGAKKIKAIAVRGTEKVPVADPEKFSEAIKEAIERIDSYPERGDKPKIGSNVIVKPAAEIGVLPVRNFQQGVPAPSSDIWRWPELMMQNLKLQTEREYCYHCPLAKYLACNVRSDIKKGPHTGLDLGGVSFVTPPWKFGGEWGMESLAAMWKCRELCQRYGMDEFNNVGFALELFQRGIITKEDTGGIELNWGNDTAVLELLGRIAYRDGFGDILAEGTVSAAKKIGKGAEKYAMTVKGMDMLGEDPRSTAFGHLLGSTVGPRGDDMNTTHFIDETYDYAAWARKMGWSEEDYMRWYVDYLDIFDDVKGKIFGLPPRIESIRADTIEGKAELVVWEEKLHAVFDALGMCMLSASAWTAIGPTHYAKLYSACTGWQISPQELMNTGDRVSHLMKAYNVREGLTRKDDDWPERFYNEPLPDGLLKGALLSKEKLNKLLDDYYELRGWDKKKGVPTKRKLIELDLGYVADELSKLELIPD
ncbi:aldehyde ferredoxin oxidoreductase family protein [Chloroflexota bacterium]